MCYLYTYLRNILINLIITLAVESIIIYVYDSKLLLGQHFIDRHNVGLL